MSTAKITAKGQITIPKELRDELGLEPGDEVHFVVGEDGEVVMQAEGRDVRNLRGCIDPDETGVTVEEMKKTVRDRGSDA